MWNTRFTRLFGIKTPLMATPMADVSGGLLAAEASRAGALSFIAAGHGDDLDGLSEQIGVFRRRVRGRGLLGIGFISHSSLRNGEDFSVLESVLRNHRPHAVQFFAPAVVTGRSDDEDRLATNVDVARFHGAKVVLQVGSVREVKRILKDGDADVLVVQGSEAGGHGLRRELGNGTLALAARAATLAAPTKVPVLAAGGIVDGRGLAAALALGCDGAVLGTRLWASREALGGRARRERSLVAEAEPDDCVRTTVPDRINNALLGGDAPSWPRPYDSSGVLRNALVRRWDDRPVAELDDAMDIVAPAFREALAKDDVDEGVLYAGQGVGDVHDVGRAFDIVDAVQSEAMDVVRGMYETHVLS